MILFFALLLIFSSAHKIETSFYNNAERKFFHTIDLITNNKISALSSMVALFTLIIYYRDKQKNKIVCKNKDDQIRDLKSKTDANGETIKSYKNDILFLHRQIIGSLRNDLRDSKDNVDSFKENYEQKKEDCEEKIRNYKKVVEEQQSEIRKFKLEIEKLNNLINKKTEMSSNSSNSSIALDTL